MSQSLELRLERLYRHPKERVFAAISDPEIMPKWFGPSALSRIKALEHDLRPGGVYRLEFPPMDGEEMIVFGEFRAVEPPRRLAYSWTWKDGTGYDLPSEVEFTLEDHPEGTLLVLRHRLLPDTEGGRMHEAGWSRSFDRLRLHLEQISEIIDASALEAAAADAMFRSTLKAVPDDKFDFQPSPTAKSPRQIAIHYALGWEALLDALHGAGRFPDFGVFMAEEARLLEEGADRETLDRRHESGLESWLAAIQKLEAADLASVRPGLFGAIAVRGLIGYPAAHAHNHAGQINYLQTIWGDLDFH
jgi:uncharacterized protein YndB with AHSA1/START domain